MASEGGRGKISRKRPNVHTQKYQRKKICCTVTVEKGLNHRPSHRTLAHALAIMLPELNIQIRDSRSYGVFSLRKGNATKELALALALAMFSTKGYSA